MSLDPQIKSRLLHHARSTIHAFLAGEDPPKGDAPWPDLPRCGVFVTLRKFSHLRGCIGVFNACEDLPTTASHMAIAAVGDPRFTDMPLSLGELKDVKIEISLLSPLERITDPLDFKLGEHGIYVKRGHRVGCFLPDVAAERHWDKQTFLSECCRQKADLPPDAWRHPDTEVYVFTVEKIGE